MSDLVFSGAMGRVIHYASLVGGSAGLVMTPVESDGMPADDDMRDFATLADLLAVATRQTAMGDQVLTGVSTLGDPSDNSVGIYCDDVTWPDADGNPIAALVLSYDPNTSSGTDADHILLLKFDFSVTPDGKDISAPIPDTGLFRARPELVGDV